MNPVNYKLPMQIRRISLQSSWAKNTVQANYSPLNFCVTSGARVQIRRLTRITAAQQKILPYKENPPEVFITDKSPEFSSPGKTGFIHSIDQTKNINKPIIAGIRI